VVLGHICSSTVGVVRQMLVIVLWRLVAVDEDVLLVEPDELFKCLQTDSLGRQQRMIFGHLQYYGIFNIIFLQHASNVIFILLVPSWLVLVLLNLFYHFDVLLALFIRGH